MGAKGTGRERAGAGSNEETKGSQRAHSVVGDGELYTLKPLEITFIRSIAGSHRSEGIRK